MNALVDLIQKIGIFMIAAQAVIHFAPEQKYEKYIRLIVGIMVLLQFISPLYGILRSEEPDWSALLSDMDELSKSEGLLGEVSGVSSVKDRVVAKIEEEIKSQLNDSLSGEDYQVINVIVRLKMQETAAQNGTGDDAGNDRTLYSLETVRVVVQAYTEEESKEAKRIRIQKITLGGDSKTGQEEAEDRNRQDTADALRGRFCEILGMDESNMEVSLYGAIEETDK